MQAVWRRLVKEGLTNAGLRSVLFRACVNFFDDREPFDTPPRLESNFNKDETMKRLTLLPLLALVILSACETVQGAGRDLETVGEAITEESQDVQAGM